MRTKAPMLFVLAVVTVGAAWQLAGINAVLTDSATAGPSDGHYASKLNELNDSTQFSGQDGGIQGQAPGSDAGNLVGIAISAGQRIAKLFAWVLLFPWMLDTNGVPYYWAYPLGILAQTIAYIGLAEFVSNREVH